MIGVVTIVLLGLLGTDFLPKDDVGQLAYTIELPVGTSKEKTLEIANEYVLELREQPDVEVVSIQVGASKTGSMDGKKALMLQNSI